MTSLFVIHEKAILSCYLDAAAAILLFLLIALSARIRRRKDRAGRLFLLFCICAAITCLISMVYNALYLQTAPWTHTAALAVRTLREYAVLFLVLLWPTYIHSKLFSKKPEKRLLLWISYLPAGIMSILLAVNLLTGILFTITARNTLLVKPLGYVLFAVDFLYFTSSIALLRYYDKKDKRTRLLSAGPIVSFVMIGGLSQFFIKYDVGALGFAIGVTLFYFSLISEIRYVDEESGLYNRSYMSYLFDMALAGKSDVKSALVLEADGPSSVCYEILQETIQPEGDVVRMEKQKFLMFCKSDSRSTLQYYTSQVDEAVDKYNESHPDQPLEMNIRSLIKGPAEDAFGFLRDVAEGRQSGDTMRSIVSMMDELDRLDKELKLAADIQINMLPMNFPAFPGRTEFDLYASMDPAREVGGDFYDFFLVDQDHLALVIADVSGKGIPAALFMMVSKTMIRNQIMEGAGPAAALEWVNDQLCDHNAAQMFVTVWLGILEISTGILTAVNAGHEYPALRQGGGDFSLYKDPHGFVVGGMSDMKYKEYKLQLSAGDRLFVFTDGIPEAADAALEMFGTDRMLEALNREPDASPQVLLQNVTGAVEGFVRKAEQFDDMTMLCLAYKGSGGENGL